MRDAVTPVKLRCDLARGSALNEALDLVPGIFRDEYGRNRDLLYELGQFREVLRNLQRKKYLWPHELS